MIYKRVASVSVYWLIGRLNSGIRNQSNFLCEPFFNSKNWNQKYSRRYNGQLGWSLQQWSFQLFVVWIRFWFVCAYWMSWILFKYRSIVFKFVVPNFLNPLNSKFTLSDIELLDRLVNMFSHLRNRNSIKKKIMCFREQ